MMALEKKLAKSDLSRYKQDPYYLLVKQLVKYSKFKTTVALEKINRVGYKEGSVRTWFDKVCQYLASGKEPVGSTKKLIRAIDEIVSSSAVEIEKPSLKDARREIKARKVCSEVKTSSSGVRFLQTLNQQMQSPVEGEVVWSHRDTEGRLGKIFGSRAEAMAYSQALVDYNIAHKVSLVKLSVVEG